MKTYKQLLDEAAVEFGFESFDNAVSKDFWGCDDIADAANKRYTTATIKEHLSRAAEKVQHVPGFSVNTELLGLIDKQSILDTEIILP